MCIFLACCAGAAGPETGVARLHGVPTFTVDGAPFLTPGFETYVPQGRYFEAFGKAGARVFMFNANAGACDYGHSMPIRPTPDTWNFAQFDQRMAEVLQTNPDGWVMPRVFLGTPRWWLDAHPDAMELLDDGTRNYREPNRNPTQPKGRPFPSLASPEWRAFVEEGLRGLIAHIQAAPYAGRLFGVEITGLDTEEWYHWSAGSDQLAGYSVHTTAAFRSWLRAKYGSDEILRAAWKRGDVTLDTAATPTREARMNVAGPLRDPDAQQDVIDFYRFYNELIPDTVGHFAKVVKSATQGKKVVGAFYGYMYEFQGDPEYGHNALARFAALPDVDFMAVTASYFNRAPGSGGDYLRAPLLSLWRGGKVWYHDNDTVSVLGRKMHGLDAPGGNPAMAGQLTLLGMADTLEGSRWMLRRSFGFALCHGLFNSFFDLHGGYFDDPELMQEIAQLGRVGTAAATADRSSIAEVLLVSSEASCEYFPFRSAALGECLLPVQHRLLGLGATVDHVLLSDLGAIDTARYKLVIVLNAARVDAAEEVALHALQSRADPPMMLWCYAPGHFLDTARGADAMRRLTGFGVVASPLASANRHVEFMPEAPMGKTWHAASATAIDTQCGHFEVQDATTLPLARYADGGGTAMAMLGTPGNACSVYSATPNLPTSVYRALARAAGVHLFTDREDTFYCSASFLTLHANGDGERQLTFPRSVSLRDPVSGATVAESATTYLRSMKHGETLVLAWAYKQ